MINFDLQKATVLLDWLYLANIVCLCVSCLFFILYLNVQRFIPCFNKLAKQILSGKLFLVLYGYVLTSYDCSLLISNNC